MDTHAGKSRATWSRDEIRVVDIDAAHRSIHGSAIGNFIEWYDFSLYSYFATTLAQVFYPGNEASAGNLIATFGTLTAAFGVRPLGGFIFGPLGDRIGRKRVLVITIMLMAVATTVTGLLPGYRTAGIWGPILLVAVRICQGLSTGGEFVGAMTYVGEHAPDRKRGMMAGFLPMGTLGGYVVGAALATVVQTAVPPDDMLSWGWRVPFLLGAPLGAVALVLRLRLEESPDFEQMDEGERASSAGEQFKKTVIDQWKTLLLCVCLELTIAVTGYMLSGYLPTYLKKTVSIPDNAALLMILLVLVVLLVAVVFVGKLSDRAGVKPLLWTGCGLLLVGSIPAFSLMRFGGYPAKFAGVLLVGVTFLCFTSVEPATLPALFPTNVRYGALSIAFNVSVSAFGGTTPLIAEALISATRNALVPAYILIFAGLVGVLTLIFTPEVAGKRLPGSGPAVETDGEARSLEGKERGSRPRPH